MYYNIKENKKGVEMFLIFNKQFRAEEKFFNEIAKKIKTTKTLHNVDASGWECYQLDSIDVHFQMVGDRILRVLDKEGNQIGTDISGEYKQGYTTEDELQRVRHNRFSHLLEFVRTEYAKRKEKAEKLERAAKQMQAKKAKLDAELAKKAEAEAVIANATKRLREL